MSGQTEKEAEYAQSRRGRMFRRADRSDVPLRTIFASVFTVAAVYVAAMVFYRLRELLMLMLVGGFVALILNPAVEALQLSLIHI